MTSIDARALAYGGFVLTSTAPNSPWYPTAQVQSLDLAAGDYGFVVMSGVGPFFHFTVDADGRVAYDSDTEALVSGAGSDTLVVTGLSASIDTTALWGGPITLRNTYDATPITSGPLRLLPGPHQILYGAAQQSGVDLTLNADATWSYADVLDVRANGCLRGRGTSALRMIGYPLEVDARGSGATALALANLTGSLDRLAGQVALLPFDDYRFILTPAVVTDPSVFLSISESGVPSMSPGLSQIASLDAASHPPVLRFNALPDPNAPVDAQHAHRLHAVPLPDRTMILLAADQAGSLTYSWQYDPFFNSYWAPFKPFGGRADALDSCQLIAAYADCALANSKITVVYALDAGQIRFRSIGADNAIWSAWQPWPGPGGAARLVDIAVCALADNAQIIVVLDATGALFVQDLTSGQPGNTWRALAAPGRTPVTAVAGTCDGTGHPVLLVLAGGAYALDPTGERLGTAWQALPAFGRLTQTTALTGFTSSSGAPAALVTTGAGQVLLNRRDRGGWSAWTELTQFGADATDAAIGRCGDLNLAAWAANGTQLQISWTDIPADNAAWTAATVFDAQPTTTFTIGVSNIDIEATRSGSLLGTARDTDYGYVGVRVGKKPPILVPLPDVLNVKDGQYRGWGVPEVEVQPDDVVTFTYTMVNAGHGDPSQIDQDLQSATQQLLDKVADAAEDALEELADEAISEAALALISDAAVAELVDVAASAFVGPLLGLVAGWLEGQITGLLFPNCDGAVAAGMHVMTGAMLQAAGEVGLGGLDLNPGSDSPGGCGGNSDYRISWSARPARPDTSVTLNEGYPFNRCSTGVRTVNHEAWLVFQQDGNLVVYDQNSSAQWAARTDGKGWTCAFQGDGNLVVYDSDGNPEWASNSDGHPNAQLVVQGDGNVVVYDGTDAVWASGTDQ